MSSEAAGNKKRYILYSKDDGRPDHMKPCAFFASSAGCKNGANCRFSHSLVADSGNSLPRLPMSTQHSVSSDLGGANGANKKRHDKKDKKDKSNNGSSSKTNGSVPPSAVHAPQIGIAAVPTHGITAQPAAGSANSHSSLLQLQQQLIEQQRLLEAQIQQQQQQQEQQQQQQQQQPQSEKPKKRKHKADNGNNSAGQSRAVGEAKKSNKVGLTADAHVSPHAIQLSYQQQQQQASNGRTTAAYDSDDTDDDDDLIFGAVNHVLEKGQRPSYCGVEGQKPSPAAAAPVAVQVQAQARAQPLPVVGNGLNFPVGISRAPAAAATAPSAEAPAAQQNRTRMNSMGADSIFDAGDGAGAAQGVQLFVSSGDVLRALQTSGTPHATGGTGSAQGVQPALQTSGSGSGAKPGSNKAAARSIFATPKGPKGAASTADSVEPAAAPASIVKLERFDLSAVALEQLQWASLVQQTSQHSRFAQEYEELRTLAAQDHAWVRARPVGDWCAGAEMAAVLAVDCEMCEATDPVDGTRSSALVRLSVVNGLQPDQVLVDSLVTPGLPVSDARTHIHGISAEQMAAAAWTLRHAQAALLALCTTDTVLVGHSLHKDLRALKFMHSAVIDTAYLYQLQGEAGAAPSLRDVAEQALGQTLAATHDSVVDARTSLAAAAKLLAVGPQPPLVRRAPTSSSASAAGSQQGQGLPSLLVHRIPDYCSEQQIHDMLVAYTQIVPAQVLPIQRGSSSTSSGAAPSVPSGKTSALFASQQHCDLAFASIAGPDRPDKQKRSQKRVYLKGGGYICVRK